MATSSLSSIFKFPSFFPSSTQPSIDVRQDVGRPSPRPGLQTRPQQVAGVEQTPNRRSDLIGKILPAAAIGLSGTIV
jgi:hypothetical protein